MKHVKPCASRKLLASSLFSALALSGCALSGANNNLQENAVSADNKPFIAVREVISSTPFGGWVKESMPLDLRRQLFLPFWTEDRLRKHVEMLKAFGFNSIQVTVPTVAMWCGADMESWSVRQRFMLKTARELGMSTAQFVWGSAIADPSLPAGGQQVAELDWHKPEERAKLEAWYRREAECAPLVDRVVTHWVDPGYGAHHCKACTIDTVVEMHNFILRIYREKNPNVRGALSVWFMQPGKIWPGYESPSKLAAHPKLEPGTDIALGLMNYGADGDNLDFAGELKPSDLEGIAAAGRRAGVWGWYTTDIEINPALHVRTRVLQNYFRKLASQGGARLAWHSVDDNFPGLNMANLYVAGKLMQDPSLDADKLLDDFARGFVGPKNAACFAAALRAVELARTRSALFSARVEDAVAPPEWWQKDRRPLPAAWLDEASLAVDQAIQGMKGVALPAHVETRWPVTMEPAVFVVELNAHLEAIRQMLAFLREVRTVERMIRDGASKEKVAAAIEALPRVPYDPAHTAGLEAAVAHQKVVALRKLAGIKIGVR
jgi:hypothetical protein